MNYFIAGSAVGALVGGAIIWLIKDWLVKVIAGEQALQAKLQAKIDALKKA